MGPSLIFLPHRLSPKEQKGMKAGSSWLDMCTGWFINLSESDLNLPKVTLRKAI